MKTKLVIIGMGSIGKRHLQAVSSLELAQPVACYDAQPNALATLPQFCSENHIPSSKVVIIQSQDELQRTITPDSLVIVATTAKGRKDLLALVLALRPKAILAEKPLCQTLQEYESLAALTKQSGIPVHIDFARQALDFYQLIRNQTYGAVNKSFRAHFPGGMVCIGIHMLALATWLLDAKTYTIMHSRCGKVYETKRPGFLDLSGQMAVMINDTMLIHLVATEQEKVFSIGITTEQVEFTVHEFAQKMLRADAAKNITLHDIAIPFTSRLTDTLVMDFERNGTFTLLPDITQSYLAHKILFEYLKTHNLENLNIT